MAEQGQGGSEGLTLFGFQISKAKKKELKKVAKVVALRKTAVKKAAKKADSAKKEFKTAA